MKSIINEIYYGNISGEITLSNSTKNNENVALYDKLIKNLSKEKKQLLNDFMAYTIEQVSIEKCEIYKLGFKTGFSLRVELFEKEEL